MLHQKYHHYWTKESVVNTIKEFSPVFLRRRLDAFSKNRALIVLPPIYLDTMPIVPDPVERARPDISRDRHFLRERHGQSLPFSSPKKTKVFDQSIPACLECAKSELAFSSGAGPPQSAIVKRPHVWIDSRAISVITAVA
jgi:hypothetical protein